ncbi:ABC transporter ATP-binding protein [Streptomyces phaeochromogenes]|uniref:ABC transporter ATP-binding protein n=1 Tax=Streptomyces phaeochromogenes TaxID=1923 RepID=UPI002DDAB2F0|nr:ABC transporter ATP-binding protein [Streptomyces phaeochromogenes]WRZ34685.1 ABC transporter ATP-binding protein [Streptomyces phaeochromogenes]
MNAPTGEQPLLDITGLRIDLAGGRTVLHAVSYAVRPGQSLGLVGESGSGKSMSLKAVLRMLPSGARTEGGITFDGHSVTGMNPRELRAFRAGQVAMIPQDPRAAANPVRTVGDFLTEVLVRARGGRRRQAVDQAIRHLADVGIADGELRLRQHPHQLSGGLLQRVMIAAALAAGPRLLLADEPTTALDVTTQQEVMAILDEQRRRHHLAMVLVTHDLDLAVAVTDDIAVMYAGTIVELAPSKGLHHTARHPYTAGLLRSRPAIGTRARPISLPGRPLSAFEAGPGCVFADRCAFAQERCRTERPRLETHGTHLVACHRAAELAANGRLLETTP